MSGIYGIINLKNQPVDSSQMNKMEELMIHRGVDGKCQWIDDNVGLGHLKLEITPESEYEQLPLKYKQWVITADCRIDNRDELNDSLCILAEERYFTPDSTYIVKAYEKWGKDCVKHLIGDFAFAIWDTVEKSLFCARDQIGIKPFFYVKTDDKFIFASEVKTVVKQKEVSIELNERKVGEYLYYIHNFYHPDETFFINILRLLPAHYLYLKENKFEIKRYWELKRTKEIKLENDEAYAKKLKELLLQAIHCRMRTNHPIGVTLSGGLDSSTVACIAAKKLAKEKKILYTASSVLPDNWEGIEEDERKYIDAVIEQEKNIHISYVTGESRGVFDNIEKNMNDTYFPINAFYYMDDALRESLKKKGQVRIILNGLTGDSGISLNVPTIPLLFKRLQWKSVLNQIQRRAIFKNISKSQVLYNELIKNLIPEKLKSVIRKIKNNEEVVDENDILINSKFEKQFGFRKNSHLFSTSLRKLDFFKTFQVGIEMHTHCFEEINIRNSFEGIEEYMPLADKKLLEFIINLPIKYFEHNGIKRGLVRFITKGLIPDKVRERTFKTVYTPLFNRKIIEERKIINDQLLSIDDIYVKQFINIDIMKSVNNEIIIFKNWQDKSYSKKAIVLFVFFSTGLFIKKLNIIQNETKKY